MRNSLSFSIRGCSKILIPLALCLTFSGCLKTRAQLRDDDDRDGPTKPVPAQVQEVQPQGQYVLDEIKSELTRMNGRIEDLERTQKQAGTNGTAGKDEMKK